MLTLFNIPVQIGLLNFSQFCNHCFSLSSDLSRPSSYNLKLNKLEVYVNLFANLISGHWDSNSHPLS